MGRHRLQPGRRAAPRPRYKRITAAGSAVAITAVAVLGGIGALPSGPGSGPVYADTMPAGAAARTLGSVRVTGSVSAALPVEPEVDRRAEPAADPALPADSGQGRRVVFDISEQRVWLVGQRAGRDVVRRTYLASGSLTDNLKPGSYAVTDRQRHAIGIDDSGTMDYFVVFTHGSRAAIGFHDIPVKDGKLLQSRAQLGTPQSHGCVRQWRPDAKALWRFAPIGTKVVVTA